MGALETWTEAAFEEVAAMCQEHGCDPSAPLSVWMSESGLDAAAGSYASGICQLEPENMEACGWDENALTTVMDVPPKPWSHQQKMRLLAQGFRHLPPALQLPFVRNYYEAYKGRLKDAAHWYVATFLPSLMDAAANPDALLCEADQDAAGYLTGPRHAAGPMDPLQNTYHGLCYARQVTPPVTVGKLSWAYYANWEPFDPHRRGVITPAQLVARATAVSHGETWDGVLAGVKMAISDAVTPTETPIAKDAPLVYEEPVPPPLVKPPSSGGSG